MMLTTRSMRTTPDSQPLRLPPGAVWSAPSTLKVAARKNVAGVVCSTDAALLAVEAAGLVVVVDAAAARAGPMECGVAVRVAATASAAAMDARRAQGRAFTDVADIGCGLTVVGEVASSWPDRVSPVRCARTRSNVTQVTRAAQRYTSHRSATGERVGRRVSSRTLTLRP